MRTMLLLPILLALASSVRAETPDSQRLAARVDQVLARQWAKAGIEPSRRSDDAEFLRRASLDLTGRIPPLGVVRAFLADTSADKRSALIERLLRDPFYAGHFANQWRELLVPDASNDPALEALDAWLRVQFSTNVPYDRLVRDVLIWSSVDHPGADPSRSPTDPIPACAPCISSFVNNSRPPTPTGAVP